MTLRNTIFVGILIGLISLIGYGIMHALVYIIPMSSKDDDNTWGFLLFTLILIALGLAVPYWMLKLGFHHAHLNNPQEKELEMKDIPKDQEDLRDGR